MTFETSAPHRKRPALLPAVLLSSAFLLLGSPSASTAFAQEHQHRPSALALTGTGTVRAEPDIAHIGIGVVVDEKTAQAALAGNNEKMSAIFSALAQSGIAGKDMATSNFSLQPRYDYPRRESEEADKRPRIVGYTASNTLTVTVRDLTKLGEIITRMADAGSNELGSIRFDTSKREELLDRARTEAVRNATHKAEIYTAAAGVGIGRLLSFKEGEFRAPLQLRYDLARAAPLALEAAPTPISGGELELSVTVSMRWEITQ